MWKEWFFFPKSDRRAILILSFLLLAGVAWRFLAPTDEEGVSVSQSGEMLLMTDSSNTGETPLKVPEPFSFDPNTADSATLSQVGLPPRVVRNLLKYRAAGGVLRTPEALSRIYGMDSMTYARLSPYILIGEQFRPKKNSPRPSSLARAQKADKSKSRSDSTPAKRDVETYPRIEKFEKGTTIGLNGADTTTLKRIPGIGSVLSRRIVSYRERLGGFYKPEQLKEIEGLPEGIGEWFVTDTPPYRKIPVNKASLDQLRRHPYLNFYQARAIVEHRKQRGALKSLQQLSLYEAFTAEDLERLQPYVEF